ncbi:hypothetical protein [Halalkalibacter urbisdiaboli]|uniref:hypothetical protein n=1 Tax=Halalkalibacter urbisdiaboli TaxID=1960589 RepID=UPI000B4467D0|nr:hypothetical protein [Halalkalibacter urbisdiaboli]
MKQNENELKEALKKFDIMIKKTPDNPHSLYVYKNFIKYFIKVKTKNIPLPASEVMSIIKHEKPVIFRELRKQDSSYLYYLTNISLEYEEAQRKLAELKLKLV